MDARLTPKAEGSGGSIPPESVTWGQERKRLSSGGCSDSPLLQDPI